MKSSVIALAVLGAAAGMAQHASAQHVISKQWQTAVPGYRYNFPRDHFAHPGYQTEWWYYTGNVHGSDGHRYGFELTFFREGIHLPKQVADSMSPAWRPDEIYLAHLAFSDLDGGEFYHTERFHRAGPLLTEGRFAAGGLAGAGDGSSAGQARYWNGNWQVRWVSVASGEQELEAVTDRLHLRLKLHPEKPCVINGRNGVSQKGVLPGEASHYLSFTRLGAAGSIEWHRESHIVDAKIDGQAWMDHEFFTEPPDNSLAGWDWFAIQLDNHEELMLYRLRSRSGGESSYSSGTYVDAQGGAHFLSAEDFELTPGESWKSAQSGASYPVAWTISVPSLKLELSERTPLKNQELFSQSNVAPSYWEGAVTYQGHIDSQAIKGVGYLEMTGYNKQLQLTGQ